MNWRNIVVCLAAVAVAAPRTLGVKSAAYQALAHLFVGILIGEAVAGTAPRRWLCAGLAVALSVLETVCFFLLR